MSIQNDAERVDITDLIVACANSLTMDEPFLCNRDSFQLQDAMAATQMMDPKMDACEVPAHLAVPHLALLRGDDENSARNADAADEKPRILFPRPNPESLDDPFVMLPSWDTLTLSQSSSIIVHLLIRLQAMLCGASVGESIFTCFYAHASVVNDMETKLAAAFEQPAEPSAVPNHHLVAQSALFTCTCGILEITDVFRGIVINADIYEEEDFVSNTHDIPFFRLNKSAMKQAFETTFRLLDEIHPTIDDKRELKIILLSLTYLDGFFSFCNMMGKLSSNQVVTTVQNLQSLVRQLVDTLDNLKQLHCQEKDDSIQNDTMLLLAQCFDSYVNRPMFGNTPVRRVSFLDPVESLTKLITITSELDWAVCSLLLVEGGPSSLGRIERMLRRISRSDISILGRSLIVLNLYFDDKILGQHSLPILIVQNMRQWQHVPQELVSSGHGQALVTRLGKPIYDTLKLQVSNRNRQRTYIEATMLQEWTSLQNEANLVDTHFTREREQNTQDSPSASPIFGYYVLLLLLRLMDQHMTCGIEDGLFHGHDQLCSALWYRDFLLAAVLQNLGVMRKGRDTFRLQQTRALETNNKGKGKKKGNKGSRATNGKLPKKTIEEAEDDLELKVLELKRLLCRGLVRFMVVLRRVNWLHLPEFEFTNRKTMFEKRYEVFGAIRHPPPLTFNDFLEGSDGSNVSLEDMCRSSTDIFQSGRKLVETILDEIPVNNAKMKPPGDSHLPITEGEARALLKVCVGNSVYLMKFAQQAAKEDKSSKKVEFDFAAHKEFCIIKFS